MSLDGKVEHLLAEPLSRDLAVVLLDLDPTTPTTPDLDVSSCGRVTSKKSFVYTGGAAGFAPATSAVLPPRSMTVVDLTLSRAP